MKVSTQVLGLLFGTSYCYAAGRSRRYSEAPFYDTGDGTGGHNYDTNHAFGEVSLPPLGSQGDYNFGQAHLDPGMYGGGGYGLQQQDFAMDGGYAGYALPPGGHVQPVMYPPQYDEYSSDATSHFTPQSWQNNDNHQRSAQAERHPWEFVQPEIFESSIPVRDSRYELPPDEMQIENHHQAGPIVANRSSRKGRQQKDATLEKLSRQAAAMNLEGLPQFGEGSGRKSQEASRHPREPQTARLPTSGRMKDDDEIIGERKAGSVRPRAPRNKHQEKAMSDRVRALVENQWAIRNLDCDIQTPVQMAAEIADIKLDNPGLEVGITNHAIAIMQQRKGEPSDYVAEYRKMGDKFTDRINYLKRKYTKAGKWTEADIDAAVRLNFRKIGMRRSTGPREVRHEEEEKEQEEQEYNSGQHNNEIAIAQEVWDDFTARLLGPAVNEGREMCMSLIGSLAEIYTHDDYDHETSRDYLVMYLREVQQVSDRDIAEMNQAGSSTAPASSSRKGKGKSKSRWFGL